MLMTMAQRARNAVAFIFFGVQTLSAALSAPHNRPYSSTFPVTFSFTGSGSGAGAEMAWAGALRTVGTGAVVCGVVAAVGLPAWIHASIFSAS